MWSDMSEQEKREVKHDAVAVGITAILVMIGLIVYQSLKAEPEPYIPECTDLYEHSSSPKECP